MSAQFQIEETITKISKFTKTYTISFAQDSSLSPQAKGIGLFIDSLPEFTSNGQKWLLRPSHIQKANNIGKSVWDRVSRELRNAGYLRLLKGGVNGGALLEFSIEKNFPLEQPKVMKTDCRKIEPLKDLNIVKNNNKQQHNTNTPRARENKADKVVVFDDMVEQIIDKSRNSNTDGSSHNIYYVKLSITDL